MNVKAVALLLLEALAMGTPMAFDYPLSSNTNLLEDRFCETRYFTKKVGDGNPQQKYYHIQLSVCLFKFKFTSNRTRALGSLSI